MTQDPRVSVIVLTYNQEDMVSETLDSLLLEPLYSNLEIVISDDASVDRTPDILRSYADRYPETIVLNLNEKNLGITGNCNAALECVTGEFIAFLAGDDINLPNKIHHQVSAFQKHPEAALCYHSVEVFNSDTNEQIEITDQNPDRRIHNTYDLIRLCGIAGASSVMVRRSCVPERGFDKRLPTVSDWKFFIDVTLNGDVIFVDEVLGRYRKSLGGTSQRTFDLLDESLRALELVKTDNPGDARLIEACDQGAARYIAGEIFRSLTTRPKHLPQLASRMLKHSRSRKYMIVASIAHVVSRAPVLGSVAVGMGNKLRSALK